MLHDPARHEPLRPLAWDEGQVRAAIEHIVRDTESRFTPEHYWPLHPLDRSSDDEAGQVQTSLYHGACGVFWALHYLQDVGAATADRQGTQASWRPQLDDARDAQKKLVQFCHGAPGIVICLAGLPGPALDDLLIAGGETTWAAGPLAKGSNLCHGTGGNGYAFLKLYQRTRDARWLERARAFAMHGIAQTREHALQYGQSRYSLWTGDPGFAIYLRDCLQAEARFPTLDVFHAPRAGA